MRNLDAMRKGEGKQLFGVFNCVDNVIWPQLRDSRADISSACPSQWIAHNMPAPNLYVAAK